MDQLTSDYERSKAILEAERNQKMKEMETFKRAIESEKILKTQVFKCL